MSKAGTSSVSLHAAARHARFVRVQNRRQAERACAADFLRRGDLQGSHSKRCVFGAADQCSRTYDPGPPPDDEKLYEDVELGSLWNMNTLATWQLAGWNITRRRRRTA